MDIGKQPVEINLNIEKPGCELVLAYIFDRECQLYANGKPLEQNCAEFWGLLLMASKLGYISWDGARGLFGEYVSKAMNLR